MEGKGGGKGEAGKERSEQTALETVLEESEKPLKIR